MSLKELEEGPRFLQPLEVITYLSKECRDFKTTNHEMVKRFSRLLKSDLGHENHRILKKTTGHLVVVKKLRGSKFFELKSEFQDFDPRQILFLIQEKLDPIVKSDVEPVNLLHAPSRSRIGIYEHSGVSEYTGCHAAEIQKETVEIQEMIKDTVDISQQEVDVSNRVVADDCKSEDNSNCDADDDEVFPLPEIKKERSIRKMNRKQVSVKDLRQTFENQKDEVKVVPRPDSQNEVRRNRQPINSISSSDERYVYRPLDNESRMWIMAACRNDYRTLLQMLHGKDEEDIMRLASTREPGSGNSALHWACKFGNMQLVHLLLGRHRAPVNTRSRGGYTPLMTAAIYRQMDVYEALLNIYGANPDIRDFSGRLAEQYLPVLDVPEEEPEEISDYETSSRDELDNKPFSRQHPGRSSSFFRQGFLYGRDSFREKEIDNYHRRHKWF